MRRHGWSGDIPADDREAVDRIIAATRKAIDAQGRASVSEVAQDLGVTRQTVYRYFPTLESLLSATAVSAAEEFLDHLAQRLGSLADPTDAVVEGIAYTLEQLPHNKYLGLVLEPGKASPLTAGVTSETAKGFGKSILQRFAVDWSQAGFVDADFDELVEFMLRILQSLILDTGKSRRGDELRAFLRRWIGPAVAARAGAQHSQTQSEAPSTTNSAPLV